MELRDTVTSIAIFLTCAVALRWAWRLFDWVFLRPKKLERCLRQQGISGNSYRLLLGDMKEVFRMRKEARSKPIAFTNDYLSRADPFLHHTITTYGKNSLAWMGPIPMVNITEPKLIREALSNIYDFQKPKLNSVISLLAPGLVSLEGKQWAMRRKLMNPAFHAEKLKMMLPSLYTSCNEMIKKWEKMMVGTDSHELDVWPYLVILTEDVISRAAFGSSYEEGKKIFELLKEQIHLTVQLSYTVFIPGLRYLTRKTNNRLKELNSQIQTLLKILIYKRKKAMEAGEATKDDLLGILMESTSHQAQEKSENHFFSTTIDDVIAECKLFYIAGQESTSVLLAWSMIMLSKHLDWQARAREEVLQTFGTDKPHLDGLNNLKIVTMILHEVLRLYPPVITMTRRVCNTKKLGHLSLPAGVMLNLAIIYTHQDCELWGDDAKEFNPKRFSEGISKATNANVSFFPFSWGPRICIGQNLAMLEAKIALTMILQHFSFELSPSYAHAPYTVLTLQPQFGADVILHRL